MTTPAHIAAHHMRVNRHNIQIVANNLAATSVYGFQADKLLVTEHKEKNNFSESLSFAIDDKMLRDTKPGEFFYTGGSLDVALVTPDVYFAVQDDNGETLYTRAGQFELNSDRNLIHSGSKKPVLDRNGTVMTIPYGQNDIKIAGDGTLSANGQVVGELGVFHFDDPLSLTKIGATLMRASIDAQPAEEVAMLHRGLESSNVDPVLSLAQLIELQRQDTQDVYVLNTYKEQSGQQIDELLVPLQA